MKSFEATCRVTVSLTRSKLRQKQACKDGMVLFEELLQLCNEQRLANGKKPYKSKIKINWTPTHYIWMCCSHPGFARWLRSNQLIPEFNLSSADLSSADLYGANLSGANLYGADLSHANLYGADLSHANLYGADLYGADLSRANLSRADLSGANLYGANLSGANLYSANLSGANLYGADLSRADLYGANLSGANLYGANLSGADRYLSDLAITGWELVNGTLRRTETTNAEATQ